MDTPSLSSTNSQRRKLVKKRPAHHTNNSSSSAARASNARDEDYPQSTRSSNSLTRRPSAPHAPYNQPTTTPTVSSPRHPSSGTQRSDPAPNLLQGDFGSFTLNEARSNYLADSTSSRPGYTGPDDFIGAPFDSEGILNRLDATKPTSPISPEDHLQKLGRHPSLQRSHVPPPLAGFNSDPQRLNSPPLHPSPRFANMDSSSEKSLGARLGTEHSMASSKRLSDDGRDVKASLRKKSGLTNFMNSLVGAPKKPIISAPENPVHLTHVGYDSNTGQFTVGRSSMTSV
jgi:p21-activated kinase 1